MRISLHKMALIYGSTIFNLISFINRKKPTASVECTVCMTTFKHDTTFPQHMKAHEAKVDLTTPIDCPVCTIEVESRKTLNPHIKDHHPEKGGCCVECLEFMPVSFFNY